MPLIVIDLFGDEEEDTKKALPKQEEPKRERERPRLREQVINIDGQVVEI